MSEQAAETAASAISNESPADEAAAMDTAVAIARGEKPTPPNEETKGSESPTDDSLKGEEASKSEEAPKTEEESDQESSKSESNSKAIDRSFAALTREEQRIREQRDELKSQREALESEAAEVRELMRLAKEDPYSVPNKLGIDFAQWAANEVGKNKEPGPEQTVAALQEQIKSLQERLDQKDTQEKQSGEEAQRQKYLDDTTDFIKTNSEQYELLSLRPDASDSIYQVVKAHWEATGKILDRNDAAELLENALEEELGGYVTKSNKLRAKLGGQLPGGNPSSKIDPKSGTTASGEPRTLSNTVASAAASRVSNAQKSDDELFAESLAMLTGR